MLAHYVRGGCWWYSSRGWTFPSIVCKFWCRVTTAEEQSGKMASGMKVLMKKRCVKELTFIDTCWMLMETKQRMWAQWDSGWRQWSDTRATFRVALHRCQLMKWAHINRSQAMNLYGAECQIQCDGNGVGKVEISQNLCQSYHFNQLKAMKLLLISYSCNNGSGYSHKHLTLCCYRIWNLITVFLPTNTIPSNVISIP
jgi:hypothetical protein